ncbi:MAG: serine/threonine-protein phosphatase, partial [Peptostreptococcaceae bacterium]|nr:serine/threonine-protein phosphatase [Peptostreptococcaceae bacterium]
FSAKGKGENNEDYILSRQLSPNCSLFLIADGMGGYSYGEIASSLACESIAEYLSANYEKSEIRKLLSDSLNIANKNINEKRQKLAVKMGTTIAGVLIERNKAYLFWVGDVRIYQFQNNEILFQSVDHSLISEMKKKGHVSTKEIERYGNIVTRSLSGIPMEEEPEIIELSLMPEDVLFLCSDGFWQKNNVSTICELSLEDIKNQVNTHQDDMDDNYSFLKISF